MCVWGKVGHKANICRLEVKSRATFLPYYLNIDPESLWGLFSMQQLSRYRSSSFSFLLADICIIGVKRSKVNRYQTTFQLPGCLSFPSLHIHLIFLASCNVINPHNSVRSNPHLKLVFSSIPGTSTYFNRPLVDTGTRLRLVSNSFLPNISDLPKRRQ